MELVIFRNGEERPVIYDYVPREEGEKPMALDVLLPKINPTAVPALGIGTAP